MIASLHISRFKSIKDVTLNCKRINVLIGPPNTGKSNILESLGMFSFMRYSNYGPTARDFVRFERTSNLFHDEDLSHQVEVQFDSTALRVGFKNGYFEGKCASGGALVAQFRGDHDNLSLMNIRTSAEVLAQFKFYRFRVRQQFPSIESDFLLPPSGDNLLALVLRDKELRAVVNQPFSTMGLRLGIRPQEGKLEVVKQLDDVIVSYPYSLTSETLQRITFYMAAILSNKKSILIFEEPESHSFPYYTKYLAEQIALDDRDNQYFISTHNPYFLLPLLEKAKKDEISVNITYFEDYQTKVKELSEDDLGEMGEIDIFSNLDRYLKPK